MISTETLQGTVRIHAVKSLVAEVGPEDKSFREQVSWLTIKTNIGDEVVFFMLYEAAQAYASAINTCNDREAEEAYVPNENTVHIPAAEWRKLNMGVPDDTSKDTDTNG